ncbi:MAG TPA: hypothetical protein VEQ66_09970 [Propionibacteriaceae bacterium]|nr:hypothetical protein [Propionibacteriaceae bacterium]
MKIRTLLPLSVGLAAGYVLGSAAGRPRYEQLKQSATDLVQHPKVQQTAFDLAGQVKANAHRIPGPAAGLVDTAATRVQDKMTEPQAAESTDTAAEVGL